MSEEGTGRAICIIPDAFLTIGLMDDGCASLARRSSP